MLCQSGLLYSFQEAILEHPDQKFFRQTGKDTKQEGRDSARALGIVAVVAVLAWAAAGLILVFS